MARIPQSYSFFATDTASPRGIAECDNGNVIFLQERLQNTHGHDLDVADLRTNQLRIAVKDSLYHKTSGLEIRIACQRASKVAAADNDHVVNLVQTKNLADLGSQIFYIITIALLSETAEIVQILPDL